ncbi:unnamed protein product [Calypogeia fissa]
MEPVKLLEWRQIWSAIAISWIFATAVNSAPIMIDFNVCEPAVYPADPANFTGPTLSLMCCPLKPTKPIIDGPPPPSTKELRVRKASQCTDAEYATKIKKGYELMKALPDDDPRSFTQQWYLHCSYCGGSFLTRNSTGGAEPIDIHFSWLFYPWHRYFMFFHERILQSLLEDPTFSLNYWNWDSPYTIGKGSKDGECLAQGDNFPSVFSDPSGTTYDDLRSQNAKGFGRFHFPDFYYVPGVPAVSQPNVSATEEPIILSNMNMMYQSLVSGGTTAETFMGHPYRYGDARGTPAANGGGGTLDSSVHSTVHFWTGSDPPSMDDMGQLAHSARDPVFFAHHSNLDRLWQVWKDIGPILGQKREYYTDADFLNASFLFYDENKDLRRVRVEDALDTTKLGYVYQAANDAAWIYPSLTRCSTSSFLDIIAQAESLPVPHKHNGYYHLEAGKPFVLVIDRPDNPHGLEEFLTIDEIKLDRTSLAGFDVYVDLLNPSDYTNPGKCAEYNGRFTNMAQRRWSSKSLVWKQSVTRTFVDIQAPTAPSKVVITIIPFSQAGGYETIKFKSVSIDF